jgi:hypothetical protein
MPPLFTQATGRLPYTAATGPQLRPVVLQQDIPRAEQMEGRDRPAGATHDRGFGESLKPLRPDLVAHDATAPPAEGGRASSARGRNGNVLPFLGPRGNTCTSAR